MSVAERYKQRADRFQRYVTEAPAERWDSPSPCALWTARDVVQHVIDMHGVALRPLGRLLSPALSVQIDPLAAFVAARRDIESVLADPTLAAFEGDTPSGRLSAEDHIDRVPSMDMVFHGWDLAKATGQDATMDPDEVRHAWAGLSSMPAELLEQLRTPGAFGPGVEVFGPEVAVPSDAPMQDRLLGMTGRDPGWQGRFGG